MAKNKTAKARKGAKSAKGKPIKRATPNRPGTSTKPSKTAKYETKLATLERRLEGARAPKALGDLAIEFHMVNYELGHDIGAMIAMPELGARALRGKLLANERASEAYARVHNLKHALFHLFEALELWPDRADRDRLGEQLVTLLDGHAPAAAAMLRESLAGLPTRAQKAAEEFAGRLAKVKYAFDWEKVPAGAGE